MAMSTHVVSGASATDDASAQVCSASDAEGNCKQDDEVEAACLDKDDKCAAYVEEGACKDNPGYMTHNCAASCKTCDAVLESTKAAEFDALARPCKDDNYQCLEWAGMGECDINPG